MASHYKVCKLLAQLRLPITRYAEWLYQLSLPITRYAKLLEQLWLPSIHHKTYRTGRPSRNATNRKVCRTRMPLWLKYGYYTRQKVAVTTDDYEKKINKSNYENFFSYIWVRNSFIAEFLLIPENGVTKCHTVKHNHKQSYSRYTQNAHAHDSFIISKKELGPIYKDCSSRIVWSQKNLIKKLSLNNF